MVVLGDLGRFRHGRAPSLQGFFDDSFGLGLGLIWGMPSYQIKKRMHGRLSYHSTKLEGLKILVHALESYNGPGDKSNLKRLLIAYNKKLDGCQREVSEAESFLTENQRQVELESANAM